MYKLVILFSVVVFSSAKLFSNSGTRIKNVPKNTVWVLDINGDDFNFKSLKSANKEERREFREVVEPSIMYYEIKEKALAEKKSTATIESSTAKSSRASSADFEDSTEHSTTDVDVPDVESRNKEDITKYDIKKRIKMIINKFILSYQGEPNLHVHLGDHNKVSLKLYFKGQYSALVVRYKNKRWNYFINPPSPLNIWFYEKHTNATRVGQATYIDIPDSIRNDFYGKFFELLTALLSFAI